METFPTRFTTELIQLLISFYLPKRFISPFIVDRLFGLCFPRSFARVTSFKFFVVSIIVFVPELTLVIIVFANLEFPTETDFKRLNYILMFIFRTTQTKGNYFVVRVMKKFRA